MSEWPDIKVGQGVDVVVQLAEGSTQAVSLRGVVTEYRVDCKLCGLGYIEVRVPLAQQIGPAEIHRQLRPEVAQ